MHLADTDAALLHRVQLAHQIVAVGHQDAFAALLQRDLQIVVAQDLHQGADQALNFGLLRYSVDEADRVGNVRTDVLDQQANVLWVLQRVPEQLLPQFVVRMLLAELDRIVNVVHRVDDVAERLLGVAHSGEQEDHLRYEPQLGADVQRLLQRVVVGDFQKVEQILRRVVRVQLH